MSQGQYESLVELLEDPRYSGHHWTLKQPLPLWSNLLELKNQRIPLPLYYNWLGVLKIGLTAHKCPNVDELYSALLEAPLPSTRSSKHSMRLRCSLVCPRKGSEVGSPYSFVTLCHLGEGRFHVKYSKMPGKATKFTKKKVGTLNKDASRKTDFLEHIKDLVTANERQYAHRKLPSLSHGVKLVQYTSVAHKKQLYAGLDEAIRDTSG